LVRSCSQPAWFGLTGLRNEVSEAAKIVDSQLAVLQHLHTKISSWWSNVPDYLKLRLDPIPSAQKQALPLLLLLRVIYHQSLCVLHSSIVPLFSYRTNTECLPYARQISAQLSFEHANSISQLLKAVPKYSIDPNRIPSFVGYAAYTACAVQIPFFWCINREVQDLVRSNVLANLRIIQQMGKQWKFITLLVSIKKPANKIMDAFVLTLFPYCQGINARTLYAIQARHPCRLEDEPKFMDPEKLDVRKSGTDQAAASILSHNEIVWHAGSSVARTDAEITDLGLDRSRNPSPPPPPGDGKCSSSISLSVD